MYHFELEPLNTCWAAVDKILVTEHWPEVGHYKDIPIKMDWSKYGALEGFGKLRCFIVRSPTNEEFQLQEIIGYAFYIVDQHLHYNTTKVAIQDILYIRQPYRGFGKSFLAWCDEQLKAEGVVTVTHHVKPWYDFGNMLTSLGYEKAETIWARRL